MRALTPNRSRSRAFFLLASASAGLALSGCFGAPQIFEEAEGIAPLADAETVNPPVTAPVTAPSGTDTQPTSGTGNEAGAGAGAGAGGADDDDEEPTGEKPGDKAAARFLIDATFGVTEDEIETVRTLGYAGWIAKQTQIPAQSNVARMKQLGRPHFSVNTDLFWEHAIEGEDQLRQRVAFALSEIVVVSLQDKNFNRENVAFAVYTDLLQEHAFGNYEDLIREIAMTPAMGLYLSHLGNKAGDPELGTAADENFARELLQLFTIGLDELDANGEPTGRATYGRDDIAGLAKVFTGFTWAGADNFNWAKPDARTIYEPMQAYPDYHDKTDKTFLGLTISGTTSPERAVDQALDHILGHPNVAPFVTRQLIQRLVTSNPSSAYVGRVAAAYDGGAYESDGIAFGAGRRGDMTAVVAAILLDPEARQEDARPDHFGRVRPPLQRFAHFARTFRDDRGATGYGAPANTGEMRYDTGYSQMAMGPPSVFGYTRPGYIAPGTWTGSSGLVAPQISLSAGATSVGYTNHMARYIYTTGGTQAPDFFTPSYAKLSLLANDPEALVDRLDLLLTGGRMMTATRQRIAEAVSEIRPSDRNAETATIDEESAIERVRIALLMAVTAPSFSVQS